jgi:hypothetical protein
VTERQESQQSLRVDHAEASETKTRIDRGTCRQRVPRLNSDFRKLLSSSPTASAAALLWLEKDGKHTIAAGIEEVRIQELHPLQLHHKKGDPWEAVLEIPSSMRRNDGCRDGGRKSTGN